MEAHFTKGLLKMIDEEYVSDAVHIGREHIRLLNKYGTALGRKSYCPACVVHYSDEDTLNWIRCPNEKCQIILSCSRPHCHTTPLKTCSDCRTVGCRRCIRRGKCPIDNCDTKECCLHCSVLCCHCKRGFCKSHMKLCSNERCNRYTCFECIIRCDGCRVFSCPSRFIDHKCTFT